MRKAPLLLTISILLLSIGCAPTIRRMGYTSEAQSAGMVSSSDCDVKIARNNNVPPGGMFIGTMKIGDSGFSTTCGEDRVLSILREEACRIGAAVIVLRDIREPDFVSSCYRVTADFIRLEEVEGCVEESTGASTVEKQTLPDKEYYSEEVVDKRVKRHTELQACLWIVGAVLGFVIGFTLVSPK